MRPQWLSLLLLAALLVGAARPPWRFTKDDVSAILRVVGREKERNWRLVSIDPGEVEGTATVRLRESVRGKEAISRIPKERILTLKKTKKGWTIESKKEVTPEAKDARLNKPGGKSCTLSAQNVAHVCADLRRTAHNARFHFFFFGVGCSDINVGQV